MAAKIIWHRYGTKLRHWHHMYGTRPSNFKDNGIKWIFGPLQLLQLAVIYSLGNAGSGPELNFSGKAKRSMDGNGWSTGDGEGRDEEMEGDRHPPHVRSNPTFQRWLRPWVRPKPTPRRGHNFGLVAESTDSVMARYTWGDSDVISFRIYASRFLSPSCG